MEENTSSGGDTIVYNIDTTGIEHRLDAVSETLQAINEPGLDKLFYAGCVDVIDDGIAARTCVFFHAFNSYL